MQLLVIGKVQIGMPAMRWIIDTAAAICVLVARNGPVLIAIMIVAPIAAAALMRTPTRAKPFPRVVRLSVPVLIVAAILDLLYGQRLANALINIVGAPGQGEVTAAWTANETYNHRAVIGYAVVIRTMQGHSVLAGMKSDAFNIYPSGRGLRTGEGDRFRVRYLRT